MRRHLPGKILVSSHTHGKQMLFRVSRNGWLGIHLGMTGKLFAQATSYAPGSHDHLILRTSQCSLVYQDPRLFGRIRFQVSSTTPDWWQRLSPSVLSPDFDLSRLSFICHRRSKIPLKALLLRQECFPGIGNWMADEILWQAHLHPKTSGGNLQASEVRRLHHCIKAISRKAMECIGRDWSNPPRSWLFLYRWKAGGSCPRCRDVLARAQVGGRTTCWCRSCQPPLPRRKSSD